MRKKTQQEVEAGFAARGYKVLEQYESAHKSMLCRCPEGHEVRIAWGHFNSGRGCPECGKITRANKRRTPESFVRKAFEDAGYTLLDNYFDNQTLMSAICPQKHQIKVRWSGFKDGHRCNKCMRSEGGKTRKRNTAKRARAKFAAEGYTLLDEYINAHTPMKFICPQGHESQMSWTNFDTGYRCCFCAHTAPVTQERVTASFAAEGYKLLDTYKGNKKRLRFICPEGHKYSMSWDNWSTGTRCAICSGKVVTRKQVKDAFEAEGYQLLSKYNRGNTQKLDFICPEGHRHVITWADFKSGCRCAICNKPSVDPNFVRDFFESQGYTLLEDYTKSWNKISYICPNGHNHSITWGSFKSGCRCPECQGKIVKHEDVEFAFAAEGYQLLDKYVRSGDYLRYICPEGHQHKIIWDAFKQGIRCPYCRGMKPDATQRKINEIQHGVSGLIYIYLRKENLEKPMRISPFAKKTAYKIHQELGFRPEDHHLDHIIPQSFFDFRKEAEIKACWHINNLRWLSAFENTSRGNRLTLEEVEAFSNSQLKLLAKASRRPSTFDEFLAQKGLIDSPQRDLSIVQLRLDLV